jgi:peptidyl-prolyl cis-trans isomerase C
MSLSQNSLLFCLALLSAGCTSGLRQDEAIARVNGLEIMVKDYRTLFEALKPKDLSQASKETPEIKNLIVKTLIRRAVILSEAHSKKISVSDEELEKAIEKHKQGYAPETFKESLLEQMVDENEWKEQIRQNLLISKIFDAAEAPKPSPRTSDALDFYEKNPQVFHQAARAVALQIVVADRNLAIEVRKKLQSSPKDFLKLAHQYSIGPEAQADAKITIEKDALPPELDKILFESPIGKISEVIPSPYGFHILRVLERLPEINKDFEQVKSEIFQRLAAEQREVYLSKFEEDLIRSAQIEYNRPLIRKL